MRPAVPSAKPLDSFPFVRSRDVEQVRDALASVYAKPVLVPTRGVAGFNATINVCQLSNLGLAYGAFGVPVGFDFPASGFFSQVFPIRGKGEIVCGRVAAALNPGSSAVVSADRAHKADYNADYEHLVLRISAHALTEKLTAMTGATINEPLRMTSLQNPRHPAARMLQQWLPLHRNGRRRRSAASRLVYCARRAVSDDAVSMRSPAQLQSFDRARSAGRGVAAS
jgi:hypothetical protein